MNRVDIWNPIIHSWRTTGTGTLAGPPRSSPACTKWLSANLTSIGTIADGILVAGGTDANGLDTSIVEFYEFDSDIWSILTPLPNTLTSFGSSSSSIFAFGPQDLLLFGGTSAAISDDSTHTYLSLIHI